FAALLLFYFFLWIARPPISTLFPYTTLFRSGFTFLNLEGEFKNGERINPAGVSSNTAEAGIYNDGGDFMPDKVIPFGYYVRKLDEKMAVGLGIFAPFGTSTDYAQGSLASGFADETM